MNRQASYWDRQLAHCDEALALCDRISTTEQLADAEAALAARMDKPQAELELRAAQCA